MRMPQHWNNYSGIWSVLIVPENGKQESKYFDVWSAAGQWAAEKSIKENAKQGKRKCSLNKMTEKTREQTFFPLVALNYNVWQFNL